MFKITIDRDSLRRSLDQVCGIVERRLSVGMGELSTLVRITTSSDGISLHTADGNAEITSKAACITEGEASVTVSARIVQDIVHRLPAEATVNISPSDSSTRLQISTGRLRYHLATAANSDDHLWQAAAIDVQDMPHSVSLKGSELKRILDKVKFAIFQDSSRPYLHGVYVHVNNRDDKQYLRGVATDGHRLAYAEVEVENAASDIPSGIIPKKVVMELTRSLGDITSEAEANLQLSESVICFATSGLKLASRLVSGDFPDYQRIIPTDNPIIASVNRRMLMGAIERVRLISKVLKFRFVPGPETSTLILEAQDTETGNATEEIEIKFSASEETALGFNGDYITDIIAQCESENVELAFGDPNGPVLIRDPEHDLMRFVLMPMRV